MQLSHCHLIELLPFLIAMSTSRAFAIVGATALITAFSAFVLMRTSKSSDE